MFGRTDKIFDLLQASSEAALDAANAGNQLTREGDTAEVMATFRAARKREKELAAQISEELVNTFVTVLDREDIEEMSSALYRIPKSIEKFAERYVLVNERLEGVSFSERTELLVACTETIGQMVSELRRGLKIESIRKLQDHLQALEAEADRLLLEPYSDFYINTADPMRAFLAKDLFEILEQCIDKCRDVGNVIYAIVLKNS
jgi:uncharacterized protein Yka (UPF0111/DUF47 family)